MMDFVDTILGLSVEHQYIADMAKVILLLITVNFVYSLFGMVIKILGLFHSN